MSEADDVGGSGSGPPIRRLLARITPDGVRKNLTAKLMLLLILGTVISGAVIVVSYTTINDNITDQVREQVESETTVKATVYENWLTERWTTLSTMTRNEEMRHNSPVVLHQWLVAEQTGISNDFHSLHVVDARTGTILGSTDTAYQGTNLYDRGLEKSVTRELIFISKQPIRLERGHQKMTLLGARSGDRLLIGAVPANLSLVSTQAFENGETSLRSFDGHRLVGNTTTEEMTLPADLGSETVVIDDRDSVTGIQVVAHDVLDAKPVDQYEEGTTIGTVVVTQAPKESAFAVRDQISRTFLLTFGLAFVLLIFTAGISMRSVTIDVNRLSTKARRISEGSFDIDMTSARLDEIGTLYESVGNMRDSLQTRIEQAEKREREKEAARAEAEQAREELRHIIDLVPDPIHAKNADGEYILANQAIAEYFGYRSPSEIEGKSSFDVMPSEAEAQKFYEDDKTVLESGEPKWIEAETLTTAEGDTRRVQTTKIPFETVETGEAAVLGYDRDVTELKARERELQEREEKYRSLFEDTHDAIMLFDREGYFDCNESALELFGIDSVGEFLEYTPWELAPARQPDGTDSKEAALQYVETAFEDGEALYEYTHQRVDGTDFPAEVKLSRFEHEGEPVLHALVRDITERKEYERQLKEQRDNLEILNQMVRHDIRNELQVVLAYADMLAERTDEAGEEYVEHVLDSAQRAAEITATAREVAEVMRQADTELAPIDLRGVLEEEIEDVRAGYDETVVTVEDRIPAVEVLADDLLESVFRNLLKNAIEHNDKDVPTVKVSATEQDGNVRVQVADNGPGIPDEKKEQIFEEGERGLESTGTGLGLYLVQTLVKRYDGSVWVEDNEPEGSVFCLDLPVYSALSDNNAFD